MEHHRGAMIPTHYKSRLPQTLSWPIGAQAISEALADAPHISEFSLRYFRCSVWPEAEFRRLIQTSRPYAILIARYQPASSPGYRGASFMVENGWYDAKWEMDVYPVLRSLRAVATTALRQHGLPEVGKWLRSLGRAGWQSRHQSVTLTFAPAVGKLTLKVIEGSPGRT